MLMINKRQAGATGLAQYGAQDVEIGFVPIAGASDFLAFTTAAQFAGIASTMVSGQLWWFVSSAACWILQGANPTALKAATSLYVPPNAYILIDGAQGAKLSVLQDGTGGNACMQRLDG